MKFRMYVDEVGNHDLKSSIHPNQRFLSLTGVITELDYVKNIIYPELENLKNMYFDYHPDEPIIFHRKEMINCKYPFESLKDYEIRNKFDRDLLKLTRCA